MLITMKWLEKIKLHLKKSGQYRFLRHWAFQNHLSII
ncbi:hypothetical protein E2C01_004295 [Portunus trituberculatus]|uniref:Uncharacterized protein n=1 Tax=Portunus trituberculatus TaxID=210409 RepID=A0A5B7CSN3_PORTR|nr:hypothetical protein [Portunus trituberculatus]